MDSNNRKKYLLKNTAIFALSNMGTKLIAFFLVPIYTLSLSTKEFGIIDLIFTMAMVCVPVLTLNISESVMRFSLDKDADSDKIMSTGFLALVFLIIMGFVVLPISLISNTVRELGVYIYFYIVSLGLSQVFMCYLRGKEKLIQYSMGNIIQAFLVAILNIIFLVVLNKGIVGYFCAYICANFITSTYAFLVGRIYKVLKNFKLDISLSKQMISYSVFLIPNAFMWWIINASDRLMVSSMVGLEENGIYAISYKLPSLLTIIIGIFTQAWSYSAIKEINSNDIEKYNNNIYNKLMTFSILLASALLAVIKPLLSIYVEQSFYESWKYTPFLIVGFVFNALGTFVATSYTVYKDSKGYLKSATIGAVVNIFLNVLLIPVIGVYGAALSTCISYFSVYIYRIINTQKYLKLKLINKENFIGMTLLLISSIVIFIDTWVSVVVQVLILLIVLFFSRVLIKDLPLLKRKKYTE